MELTNHHFEISEITYLQCWKRGYPTDLRYSEKYSEVLQSPVNLQTQFSPRLELATNQQKTKEKVYRDRVEYQQTFKV